MSTRSVDCIAIDTNGRQLSHMATVASVAERKHIKEKQMDGGPTRDHDVLISVPAIYAIIKNCPSTSLLLSVGTILRWIIDYLH